MPSVAALSWSSVETASRNEPRAARAVQIGRDVATGWLQVAEHGNSFPNRLEVIDRERHTGGPRDGEEMQDRVGRPPDGHHDGDGVFERLASENLARQPPGADSVGEDGSRASRTVGRFLIFRGHGG